MLIVDDILSFPIKSIFWIFRELHHAVQEETGSEAENITQELSELYMMLETGKLSEEAFDEKETKLLDRLDALENSPIGKETTENRDDK